MNKTEWLEEYHPETAFQGLEDCRRIANHAYESAIDNIDLVTFTTALSQAGIAATWRDRYQALRILKEMLGE